MSHTERVIQDENNLNELKIEVDKIAKLKADYLSQKEVIISFKEKIQKLEEQNMNLKKKISIHQIESNNVTQQNNYCWKKDQERYLKTFRILSPQIRTGLNKNKSQQNLESINRSYQAHYYNKNEIIQNFVDDLKFQLMEKEKTIIKIQYEIQRLRNRIDKYKKENQKLKSLFSQYNENNQFLIKQNQILKANLKDESETRYQLQQKIQQLRNLNYKQINDKINQNKDYERQFMKMDQIYKQFQKIIGL